MSDLDALARRVQVLEDKDDIRRLKATYCELCDNGLDKEDVLNELLGHFINDAKLDFGMGEGSTFEGLDGLKLFFGQVVPGSVSFSMHMVHNSIIDIDGDTAKGRYYFEAPTTNAVSKDAQWMAGRYIEEYVRVDNVWKYKSICVEWNYVASYKEGWGDLSADFKEQAAGE